MRKYDDFLAEQLQDEEFRKEYERLQPEFDVIRAIADARISRKLRCTVSGVTLGSITFLSRNQEKRKADRTDAKIVISIVIWYIEIIQHIPMKRLTSYFSSFLRYQDNFIVFEHYSNLPLRCFSY